MDQRSGSPTLLIDIDIPENDLSNAGNLASTAASNLSNSNPSLNSGTYLLISFLIPSFVI